MPQFASVLTSQLCCLMSRDPYREGRDLGIDLVAETLQGTRWAIQAKYRTNKSTTLTRNDLNSFSALSFAHCNNIDYGLVTHTTVNPTKKLPVFFLPAVDS